MQSDLRLRQHVARLSSGKDRLGCGVIIARLIQTNALIPEILRGLPALRLKRKKERD